MCEPAHSIVQYPNDDNDDNDQLPGLPIEQKLNRSLGSKVVSWGKKILNWFHFSKLGSGHSESISLSGKASLILPEHTRYEGLWWDRKFIIDGGYYGYPTDKEVAIQCAEQYHKNVVMSSMSKFRRFFETSIQKSDWGSMYVDMLLSYVLTPQGRDNVLGKLRRIFGKGSTLHGLYGHRASSQTKDRATKVVMGFTRKRNLFLPHWADDDTLWQPGQS